MVYKLGRVIGKGSDGVVYELIEEDKSDKIIKFIQGEMFGIKNYIEHYILNKLEDKYITKCLKVEIEENGLIKIIQNKALMDLKSYIHKNKLKYKEKRDIMNQLIDGISYLHSKNIIHGDIKPSNILVFKNNKIKYTDFNLSFYLCKDTKISKNIYTLNFRPPEIYNGEVGFKSDIFALGCTFFEIYYGYSYFNFSRDKKFYHIKNNIEEKEENLIFNDLIQNMLKPDIKSRISLKDLKNHIYFYNCNFDIFNDSNLIFKKEFKEILETNMDLLNISNLKDRKIFLSKFDTNKSLENSKSYKIIERKIINMNFDFVLR